MCTAACYYRSHDIDGACVDKHAGLKVLSVVIVSNEAIHERNIAFSCNMKFLEIVIQQASRKLLSGVKVALSSSFPDFLFL